MNRAFRISLVSWALGSGLLAQTRPEKAMDRVTIETNRLSIVAANVPLTAAQSEVFWPLYHAYQRDLMQIGDRFALLMRDYAANYQSMTDAKAEALLDEFLRQEDDRIKLRKTYVKKFRKVLPAKVVVRYFQVENKLDAIVRNELAAEIPLIQ